jgi:hypothetical protein
LSASASRCGSRSAGGEIERDRERLPQHEAAVVDRRQPAVGVDREIVRFAGAGSTDLERNMLVIEIELLGDPEHAKGAGAGNPVNAQGGHYDLNSLRGLNVKMAARRRSTRPAAA